MSNEDNDNLESFGHGVLACVADLNTKVLPRLTSRYDPMVVATAIGEHIGSALRILIQRKICAPEEARQVIERIRSTAFLRQTMRQAQAKRTRSKGKPTPKAPPDTPPDRH